MDGKGHLWSRECIPRQITQDGKTILLRLCSLCGRNFAQRIDGPDWRAVHIGVFRVELLADAVNKRWREEECPRRRDPDDAIARTAGPFQIRKFCGPEKKRKVVS
jgi:hypothetical protein